MSYPLDKDRPYLVTGEVDKKHVQIVGTEKVIHIQNTDGEYEFGGTEGVIWRNYPKERLLTKRQKQTIRNLRENLSPRVAERIVNEIYSAVIAEHSPFRISDE